MQLWHRPRTISKHLCAQVGAHRAPQGVRLLHLSVVVRSRSHGENTRTRGLVQESWSEFTNEKATVPLSRGTAEERQRRCRGIRDTAHIFARVFVVPRSQARRPPSLARNAKRSHSQGRRSVPTRLSPLRGGRKKGARRVALSSLAVRSGSLADGSPPQACPPAFPDTSTSAVHLQSSRRTGRGHVGMSSRTAFRT